MAEYRPKNQGLERVLGTGALFSTAYGNVGSSIYYALGLVAGFALGMTPVVFVIAGLIFAATAATYAEATTMYPEAGGSASFARRAFNEFWSFFAGWAQMLTYIITIAISAFFVPHYLGVFWEPLGESPADIFAGIAIVVLLGLVNIVGVKESAGVNIGFAVADFLTQVGLVLVGVFLVLDPSLLVEQVDFGTTPTVSDFLIAIPVAMVAYTGIETVSNMAEEARDYGKTIPRGIGLVVAAVAVIYSFLPAIALSAMPVVDGETTLGKTKEEGGYADDPILGVVENMDLGALQGAAEIYVGILAATILFIATNAGLIGVSRLSYSMGQHRQLPELLRALHPKFRTPVRRDHHLRRGGVPRDRAGPGGLPGGDLRVRGDALVHDRPRLAHHPARHPARRRSGPGGARGPSGLPGARSRSSRSSAGSARASRCSSRPCSTCASSPRGCSGSRWASRSTSSTAAARGSRSPKRTRS